ncbi:MAG: hypothetical protein ABIH76_08805 [Candidatus Bathyarchaeota archaeon]
MSEVLFATQIAVLGYAILALVSILVISIITLMRKFLRKNRPIKS